MAVTASKPLPCPTCAQTTAANGVAEPADGAALGTGATGSGSATIYVKDGKPTIPLQAQSVTTTLAPVSVTTKSTGKNADSILSGKVTASATVSTLQPSIGLNYIICTQGVYPDFD